MSRFWFNVPHFPDSTAALQALAPVGARLMPPLPADTSYHYCEEAGMVLQQIGSLTVYRNGLIRVWPYRGLTDPALTCLIACASEAFQRSQSGATGWKFRRRQQGKGYWWSEIAVRAPADDPIAALARQNVMLIDQERMLAKLIDAVSEA